jgi:beta-glucanase (GH16 family)
MVDLTGYRLTFDDEFNQLSVSATGSGTVWASTRPGSILRPGVDIGFGQSAFVDPSTGVQPFQIVNGALQIQAAPATGAVADLVYPGLWTSGLLQASNSFSQTYGYFEMRAELPAETGAWPGFWLLNADGVWPPEIDIVEAYGADPTALTNTIHTGETGQPTHQTIWSNQPTLSAGYHTFGALWTASTITFFYDGNPVGQVATPSDMHGPMYPLVNLAITRGIEGITDSVKTMSVDYIRVYSADPSATAVALQTVSSPDGADTGSLYGASASNVTPPPPTAKPDTLTIRVSGDSWNGAPKFVVSVDGTPLGEVFSVDADHAAGQWQDVTVQGNFGAGPHQVAVTYINDGNENPYYDAAANKVFNDRNLFVTGIALNATSYGLGSVVSNSASVGWDLLDPNAAVMAANGTLIFGTAGGTVTPIDPPTTPALPTTPATPTTPTAPAAGQDTLTIRISGDSWNGAPQFVVSVDGTQVGGPFDVTADHAAGQWQDVSVQGSFGAGPHQVTITYLNDGNENPYYDAVANKVFNDRNLFVTGIALNGTAYGLDAVVSNAAAAGWDRLDPNAAVMAASGNLVFGTGAAMPGTSSPTTPVPTTPTAPVTAPGQDTLTVHISGDSWNGAPRFVLSVDGTSVGGPFDVTADHAAGQWQDVSVQGDFGAGPHQVTITYLNDGNENPYYDAVANKVFNDRNLFVTGIDLNGTAYGLDAVVSNMAAAGWDRLDPNAAVMAASGTLVFGTGA